MSEEQSGGGQLSMQERIRNALENRDYELIGELGRGGMGVVYLAQHRQLGRRVAIKTLTPDRQTKENSIRRFEREAKTFAQIRHDNIAALYEFQGTGPVQFLALEYIEGTDLERERRKSRRWTPQEVADILEATADALEHTHKKGILHRDIKPGNILIENGTNRVVLTDFGLAKGEQDDTLTASGFAVGTPAYMAPEQITDQFGGKPDGRADLFSLGTVAYEMLTGKHPYLANDDLNTMRNIVNKPETKLTELDPNIPTGLADIVHKLLQKNPTDRPADAAVVTKAIDDWKHGRSTQSSKAARQQVPQTPPPAAAAPVAPASAPAPATQPSQPAPQGITTKLIVILAVLVVLCILIGMGITYVLLS